MQFPSVRVDGKVAIITGTGTGLGQAAALALAQAGAKLVLTELPGRTAAAEATAKMAQDDYGAETLVLPLDVMQKEQISGLVQGALDKFGQIDVLVNNAGVNIPKFALDVTEEDWDRVLDINLKGLFFTTQAVGRAMIERKSGKIINIASQMGVVGYTKRAAYCSSKAGVVNLTRVLAFEWAQYGIRVNAIGPTFVETPLTRPMFEDQAFRDDVLGRIPLGQLAKPEDIAGGVVYLASAASDMVTGHTLLIDGGWTAV
ncbi:MAG TPA: glucose 1-dehydrogenase [Thermomicrobiales bacterium]|jgi:2-deoxy-D-gluconate 3-dehydrogenase